MAPSRVDGARKRRRKNARDVDSTTGVVVLARVGTPDAHETRIREGKRYTELRLEGRRVRRSRSDPDVATAEGKRVRDIFAKDDLGRFLRRAESTPSLDKYLEDFYGSDLAKNYSRAGRPSGLTIDHHHLVAPASEPTPTPTPTPTRRDIGRTFSGGIGGAPPPRTPSPSYERGVKAWRGRSKDVAEIECAIVVDYVTRVKRLPPCVPRVTRHVARRTVDGRDVEYSLEVEHVDNASVVDPNGRHADPTLAAYLEGDDFSRDPEGFRRRLDGVFAQILLALSGLQRHCGFVHNDLHTKNVLLRAREGTGPMIVHDAASGRAYVFDDDVPLVKLIDFGDAMVRHPETGRVVSSRWTSHLQGFTNGADLRRLAIVLARHANGRPSSFFSDEMTADLVSIIDPTEGDVSALDDIVAAANANPNVERFGFPLVGFATPSSLLATGRVADRLVDGGSREGGGVATHAAPENIFHELPDDGWSSGEPFARFARREGGSRHRDYAPCHPLFPVAPPELVQLRDHAAHALVRRLDDDPDFETRPDRLDFEAVVAYGPSADTRTRRRVAWTGLVLFQRAVAFYLRTFASVEVRGCVDLSRVGSSRDVDDAAHARLSRLVSRNVNEVLGIVDDIVGASRVSSDEERRNKKSETTRLVLRLCLVAACGGHGQFFAVKSPGGPWEGRWFGAVARVAEAYDAVHDAGGVIAPAETLIRDAEDAERRAYAGEEKRDGRGPTIARLFEWSGDCASAYSFDVKTLEDLVTMS
ncbi:MAG: hypothetical protein CMI16_06980 [Opitutaceae bacterium]|nr:hypothetical protein [Opitutaceae bacterium]